MMDVAQDAPDTGILAEDAATLYQVILLMVLNFTSIH
jgi:hypothetical protein